VTLEVSALKGVRPEEGSVHGGRSWSLVVVPPSAAAIGQTVTIDGGEAAS